MSKANSCKAICAAMAGVWTAMALLKGDFNEAWAPGLIMSQVWVAAIFVIRGLEK